MICISCDEPIDPGLYSDDGDTGPLCQSCYDEKEQDYIQRLKEEDYR